ncbi:2Fe-2S iron-sulfur cluster-binding protein [Pseudonocardia benzenivorans]|nr:carbon monoxide dehydrogenase [Pseudonocardia sp. D17]
MTGYPRPRPGRVGPGEATDVRMTVNGAEVTVAVTPRMHLADVLREQVGLTGTHLGCEHGVCGMCTVLVDGDAARACLLLAVQCDGAEVVTVEGLGRADDQHPLQRAFSAHHGLQCGFCTPGMLMSSYDLLANGPRGTSVTPEELPAEMSGVLCRCTGYRGILAAVADTAAAHPDGLPPPGNLEPRTVLARSRGPAAAEPGTEQPASGRAGATEVRVPSGAPSASVAVSSELTSDIDDVWAVVLDFRRLARCLPGAELVETLDGGLFRGRARVPLGPVTLAFEGLAQVLESDPEQHRMRLVAQGTDVGGSATQADIRLAARPGPDGGTVLVAAADLHLTGRIAQFGRALAGDVSRRMFEQLARAVDEAARTGTDPVVSVPGPARVLLGVARDAVRRVAAEAVVRLRTRLRPRPRRGRRAHGPNG